MSARGISQEAVLVPPERGWTDAQAKILQERSSEHFKPRRTPPCFPWIEAKGCQQNNCTRAAARLSGCSGVWCHLAVSSASILEKIQRCKVKGSCFGASTQRHLNKLYHNCPIGRHRARSKRGIWTVVARHDRPIDADHSHAAKVP